MPLIFLFLIVFSCVSLSNEVEEQIKVSFNQDWNFLPSADKISAEDIKLFNPSHPKEIFNTSAGSWISRGSGQESLISLRSPVLTGSGACGSFLILEDGLPLSLIHI